MRGQRRLAPCQHVEQSGFTGVRRTHDGDLEAIAQAFGRNRTPYFILQVRQQAMDQIAHLGPHVDRHILIGEVDGRFDQRSRPHHTLAPTRGTLTHGPGQNTKRLPPLRLGLGVDQIRQTFDLRQIEAAILKGAAGEFAGYGHPQTRLDGQSAQDGGQNSGAAVGMKLDHILAGKAVTGSKDQYQRLVQHQTIVRQPAEGAMARRRKLARQRRRRRKGLRPGNADDRQPRLAARGGRGENRVHRRLSCSSNRRSRHWIWSASACRSGIRSRQSFPSVARYGGGHRSWTVRPFRSAVPLSAYPT